MADRITNKDLDKALSMFCAMTQVPYIPEHKYLEAPGDALEISGYDPGDGWRGTIRAKNGRMPWGERLMSRREIYDTLHRYVRFLEWRQSVREVGE